MLLVPYRKKQYHTVQDCTVQYDAVAAILYSVSVILSMIVLCLY